MEHAGKLLHTHITDQSESTIYTHIHTCTLYNYVVSVYTFQLPAMQAYKSNLTTLLAIHCTCIYMYTKKIIVCGNFTYMYTCIYMYMYHAATTCIGRLGKGARDGLLWYITSGHSSKWTLSCSHSILLRISFYGWAVLTQ